jgi:hypothetical protein
MTATIYPVRLFGGRHLGVTYDSVAGTLSIQGQSLTLSSLSAALQAQWSNAIASTGVQTSGVAAFGGDNVSQAVGNILDAAPTWRTAVQAAVANYAASIAPYGDPEGAITM